MVEYIDNDGRLAAAVQDWRTEGIIAIDTESENNLHRYGVYLSLIQLTTQKGDYIIDALRIKDLSGVKAIFEDERIEKVFHDTGFDFRILHDAIGARPKNIFDTQVAALLLGEENIGLGSLLEKYFGVKKTNFQTADWTRRPLSQEMLDYAAADSRYLIKLRNLLRDRLIEKGRLEWAEEEFRRVESMEHELKGQDFFNIPGARSMEDSERAVLKRLYDLRDSLARKVDRPTHFILSNKMMVEIAKNPRKPSLQEWRSMTRVHPIVRRMADRFYAEVRRAEGETIPKPEPKRRRMSFKENESVDALLAKRDMLSSSLGIQGHLIISREQAEDIVRTGNTESLKLWQKKMLDL